MKILLVGEYSRLHNSLKEGLEALGHQVTLIASGDYFKNFPADIKLTRQYDNGFGRKLKIGIYKIFKKDITSISLLKQALKQKKYLRNYDVVQLINEKALGCQPSEELTFIKFLKQHNKNIFLLCCGTDYLSVKYAYEQNLKYSILTPYFEGKISKKNFQHIFNYIDESYIPFHNYIFNSIKGVFASDMDYHIPMKEHPSYLGFMPNPINTQKIKYLKNPIRDKIVIFHGINRGNFFKKGNDLFEKALKQIQKKYPDKVSLIITENVPYAEYIKSYNKAHILLDQVYAYDQGYNALEAMAKGKVVFTGAEKEFLTHYKLQEDEVCINALPDVKALTEKLSWLIENPDKIEEIGKNARRFIEKHHDYRLIAKKYAEAYTRF
ncbi:MAG: glycosyltransferase family protein [Mesonia hippocampi]|uniref:glycosyltransferase family protein n=1 Tax=Mesonia hippocampi TaxID=1628250 RepID=UPI003F9638EB